MTENTLGEKAAKIESLLSSDLPTLEEQTEFEEAFDRAIELRDIKDDILEHEQLKVDSVQDQIYKENKLTRLKKREKEIDDWLDNKSEEVRSAIDRRDRQVQRLIEVAELKKYSLMAIPYGGKAAIRKYLEDDSLFTAGNFEHVWKAAKKRGLIQVENVESYRN